MLNNQLWSKTINNIENKINEQHFKTWIKPIYCEKITKEIIILSVGNKFVKEWITKNYLDLINSTLKDNNQ